VFLSFRVLWYEMEDFEFYKIKNKYVYFDRK
jgi:hypothetical protein